MTSSASSSAGAPVGRFGMFAGVFTPNVLTILGIILFLRLGWVVGQAGVWGAIAIVLLANAISFLTGLSLSSIATSMQVRTGGNYYLISRTLGLEIGGAIGIPLYLSQAISIAFYIIGFTEALYTIEAVQQIDPRIISTGVALIFGIISFVGADFALKIQFFILAVLIASILSFFAGGWGDFQPLITQGAYTEGVSFWVVFAVFFPAVTGIEVGVSMSGDLKDPSRDIPRGTLLSIVVTAVVYILVVLWFATHASTETLLTESMAMQSISVWPALILAGVWASTLSSALGSILAAPRTLQAIAFDGVVPRLLGERMGSPTEPRVAVIASTVIAVFVIWLGDLNFVAPIISMFFLNTYGMVNLVAGLEGLIGNPSFRPRFKIHWTISLLGALGCYGAMFLINTPATIVALVITYGIYFLLQRRQIQRTWGDVRSGILFTLARTILLRLENMTLTSRNWRPNVIVFTGQPHNRESLVQTAAWLTRGRGIVTFFQLLIGDVDKLAKRGLRDTAYKNIRKYVREHNLEAFTAVEVAPNFSEGALMVIQAHGIGGLEPNSVLMGWSRTPSGRVTQLTLLRRLDPLHKSVIFLHPDVKRGFGNRQKMQVWWRGRGGNGDLMLLIAYLMHQHPDWRGAEITLIQVIDNDKGVEGVRAHLEKTIERVRVPAKAKVIVKSSPGEPMQHIIRRNSYQVDLTFLGIGVPSEEDTASYAEGLNELVEAIGTVMMIHSGKTDERLIEDS